MGSILGENDLVGMKQLLKERGVVVWWEYIQEGERRWGFIGGGSSDGELAGLRTNFTAVPAWTSLGVWVTTSEKAAIGVCVCTH